MTGPDKPHNMIREDEAVTPAVLRDLFSMDDDEVLDDTIPTHDGDWIREGENYHFWRHADVERDYVNGACPPVALEHFGRDTGKSEKIDVSQPEHSYASHLPHGSRAQREVLRRIGKHPDLAAPYGRLGTPSTVGRDLYRDFADGFRTVEERAPHRPSIPVVIIESRYAGNVERNTAYARLAMADSLSRGEAPFASHLLYTQIGVLDDSDPVERKRGMEVGWEFMRDADLVAVYVDLGISEGMKQGIAEAERRGLEVVFREINGWRSKLHDRPTAPVAPRAAIKNALKRLDEIDEFPSYEEAWPWWRRAVRVWLGTEEEWIEKHEALRRAFYREDVS